MSYNPVAGALGHAIATLFRVDPKRTLDEDLVRLKSLLEEGKTRAHHEPVAREEVLESTESPTGGPAAFTGRDQGSRDVRP
jgi:hypothetical protein